eukprot:6202935-Pleurochrysis_carterae.AAC.1
MKQTLINHSDSICKLSVVLCGRAVQLISQNEPYSLDCAQKKRQGDSTTLDKDVGNQSLANTEPSARQVDVRASCIAKYKPKGGTENSTSRSEREVVREKGCGKSTTKR